MTKPHKICADLLPAAPRLMLGELIERIKRAAIAIDPDYAENMYHRAGITHLTIAGADRA